MNLDISLDEKCIKERVSVVIPCYNVGRFVARCFDSILGQTIGIENIEIIAVNDCSTDDTLEVIKAYEARYPDVICLINMDKNSGPGYARNLGVTYASGDYITYVDSDDCIAPDMFEKMLIAGQECSADVISCDFVEFKDIVPDSNNTNKNVTYECHNTEIPLERRKVFARNAMLPHAVARLYKKSFLMSNPKICFLEDHRMEDMYYTYCAMAYSHSWCQLDERYYYYYQNTDSIMKSDSLKTYYMDVYYAFVLAMDRYKEAGVFDQLIREISYVYYFKVYKDLMSYMNLYLDVIPKDNSEMLLQYMLDNFPELPDHKHLSDEDRCELKKLYKR